MRDKQSETRSDLLSSGRVTIGIKLQTLAHPVQKFNNGRMKGLPVSTAATKSQRIIGSQTNDEPPNLLETESPAFGHQLKDSDQLETKSVSSSLSSDIALFPIECFTDIKHEFLHEIPKKYFDI